MRHIASKLKVRTGRVVFRFAADNSSNGALHDKPLDSSRAANAQRRFKRSTCSARCVISSYKSEYNRPTECIRLIITISFPHKNSHPLKLPTPLLFTLALSNPVQVHSGSYRHHISHVYLSLPKLRLAAHKQWSHAFCRISHVRLGMSVAHNSLPVGIQTM